MVEIIYPIGTNLRVNVSNVDTSNPNEPKTTIDGVEKPNNSLFEVKDITHNIKFTYVAPPNYSISITQPLNATIISSNINEITHGDILIVSLIIEEGYEGYLLINGQPSSNFYSDKIYTNITISAVITAKIYTFSVIQPSNGTISINSIIDTSFSFIHGDGVELFVAPASGYKLGALHYNLGHGNVAASSNPFNLIATADTIISADVMADTATLTINQPANGNITVDDKIVTSYTDTKGTSVIVKVNVDSGYELSSFTVDGVAIDNPTVIVLGEDLVINAVIQQIQVPTNSINYNQQLVDFTVPAGVTVIKLDVVTPIGTRTTYVGVTPNKTYNLSCREVATFDGDQGTQYDYSVKNRINMKDWFYYGYYADEEDDIYNIALDVTLSWSPTINNITPNVTDY